MKFHKVLLLTGIGCLLGVSKMQAAEEIRGVLQEIYTGINESSVSDLTNAPNYPDQPTTRALMTDLLESEVDVSDSYGQRFRALLEAPLTGDYVFVVSSDDQSFVYLSTDENPNNKRLIAAEPVWNPSRDWFSTTRRTGATSIFPGMNEAFPANRSDYAYGTITLQAGERYYFEALHKEGGGGDNFAVGWTRPGESFEGPIPANNFVFDSFGLDLAPTIVSGPTSQEVVEGLSATFTVSVESVLPATYQWQRNGADMSGETGSSLTLEVVSGTDDGDAFRCVVDNGSGSGPVTSAAATLTVQQDLEPPTVVRVANEDSTHVLVTFSEPVDEASASQTGSYSLSGGVSVTGAARFDDLPRVYRLTTTALTSGNTYTLGVTGVADRSGAANVIAPGAQVDFVALPYGTFTIGDPAQSGTIEPAGGGYDLTVASGGISGTDDNALFGFQSRTGDFDISARLETMTAAAVWSRAGLVARESLDEESRYSGVFATPLNSGVFFARRNDPGAEPIEAGAFPINYPYLWVRLTRSGDLFSGFVSYDGQVWHEIAAGTTVMPETVHVGMMADSNLASETLTASFRDVGDTTFFAESSLPPTLEPPGPSSRRTGLVISEIMYHPADREDLRELEFIEIFNTDSISQDLSNFRISGDVDYVFPPGSVLGAGQVFVIAEVPADVEAVHGLSGVLGPYNGSLPNSSGVVQLLNRSGAILLEVEYESTHPWPVAADGAGPSLVLRRPSYGESQVEAWAASSFKGGSPGRWDGVLFDGWNDIVINEWLAHTDDPQEDFIELYNRGDQPWTITGAYLTDRPQTNKFQISTPTVIPAGGFVSFTQSQLGFALSTTGESIYLVSPDNQRVLDAVQFEGQANGVSSGRVGNGSKYIAELAAPTPGAANAGSLIRDVVINEIMFQPLGGNDDDEYIELHNTGDEAVDVSGWRFVDGIDFTFPEGASIPAGGHVVVARNAPHLIARYPSLTTANTFGDYGGMLSNSGERVALAKREETTIINPDLSETVVDIYITVDEVTYVDGGRWGKWANGDGSSLELRDPRGDNDKPDNWGDSDDSSEAPWVFLQTTGVLDLGQTGGGRGIDELHVMLLGAGESLVDTVNVSLVGGGNRVSNNSFGSGVSGWEPQGNHIDSRWNSTEGFAGVGSLEIIASGGGDNGANRLRTPLTSDFSTGQSVTISARARWKAGSTNLLLRLYGNYLELSGNLTPSPTPGTPGEPNSILVANRGPSVFDVTHFPILPSEDQDVVVTARFHDNDGLNASGLRLRYRVDPSTTLSSVTMNDAGVSGDAVAGDGLYSATVPGQSRGTLVAFHVEAADSLGAISTFPDEVSEGEALVRFGELEPFGNFSTYRIWLTQATVNEWSSRLKLSNHRLDGTFVYGNSRVIYNIGARYRGSPFIRPGYNSPLSGLTAYVFVVPRDNKLMGVREFNLDGLEQPGRDRTLQREKLSFWIGNQLDIPFSHQNYINLFVNGIRRAVVYTDSQQPDGEYVDSWLPDSEGGELYKIDDWFEFTPDAFREFNVDATMGDFTTTGGVKKKARYRWSWERKSYKGYSDDYTSLFHLADAMNLPGNENYEAALRSIADIEQWLRVFALRHIVGDWDGYGFQRGKNMSMFKRPGGKFHMLPWDLDFSLGGGSNGPEDGIFGTSDPAVSRIYDFPPFRRLYLQAYDDAVKGPLAPENIEPLMDEHYRAFLDNNLDVEAPENIKVWVEQRRAYLAGVVASADAPFAVTTNNGQPITTDSRMLELTGTAPIELRGITVNGLLHDVEWLDVNAWRMFVALQPGAQTLNLAGVDRHGQPLPGVVTELAVNFTGSAVSPLGLLVINEMMTDPPDPEAEFIEIYNRSATEVLNLSGIEIDGLGYVFPPGAFINPGEHLVLAANATVYHAVYGLNENLFGEYGGRLDNAGEQISLISRGATPEQDVVIDTVRYDRTPPWPAAAVGLGGSLQLRDAAQDNNRVGNWAATTETSPGSSVTFVPLLANWRYEQSGTDLGVAWRAPDYDDSAWPEGGALLYHTSATLPAPKTTPLDLGNTTYYFRTTFQNNLADPVTKLLLNLIIDDGAVIHLNGEELFRIRMPAGEVGHGTFAEGLVATAAQEGPFELPAGLLVSGENTLAVEVHQINAGSSDIVMGLEMKAEVGGTLPFTPGAPNYSVMSLPPFPDLWINELQVVNASGPFDNFGEREPWLELYNGGASTVSLDGLHLSNDYADPDRWAFPSGLSLASGQFMIVWLDNEPGQTAAGNLHASFRPDASSGGIALSRVVQGEPIILDYLNYQGIAQDRSYGRFADGAQFDVQEFQFVTPGAPNNPTFPAVNVLINEWMADNSKTVTNPIDGAYDDWFELYNAGGVSVDLSGFYLTDDLDDPTQWQIPPGTTISAGGFLLVWADNQAGHVGVNPLHAPFALGRSGEAIGLFAPDLSPVDAVTFGSQATDVSQGRFTDGAPAPHLFLTTPTPGTANIYNPPGFTMSGTQRNEAGQFELAWAAEAGRTYRVYFKNDLADPEWTFLLQVSAGGSAAAATDTGSVGVPQRFYLIELLP